MTSVRDTLRLFHGKRVFFEPVGGNNGDTLIEMGSRHVLSQSGVLLVCDPRDSDAIVINGSGSLAVELWSKGLHGLRWYAQEFSDKPLIILPSSYHFNGCDFAGCFADRCASAYLFARERYSFELIREQRYPSDVQVGLDHDMAFALRDTDFLSNLRSRSTQKHILIVERFDIESATGAPRQLRVSAKMKMMVPGPLRRILKSMIHTRRSVGTGFTQAALQRLYLDYPQLEGLPVLAQDISSAVGFTFEQFTQAIAGAAAVVTTRLHVATLAAMLGKITFVKAGTGPYQKIRGCYEYSMADLNQVMAV